MTTVEILTVLAILFGPVVGVMIARNLEDRRSRNDRRMDIFRTLMRTRRTPMWPDHVGALNLVEIEFAKDNEVMTAWRAHFKHLGEPQARRHDEELLDHLSNEDKEDRERRYYERLGLERAQLLARLLHAMAKALDFKAEQLEIFEGGYTPQGWSNIELQQDAIRRYAVDLYLGRRVLPVAVVDYLKVDPEQQSGEGEAKGVSVAPAPLPIEDKPSAKEPAKK